jgi:riboflavin kinase/FMN adenylyltransferase
MELLAEAGIAQAMVCRFNASFAALSADQFIDRVLVRGLRVRT